MTGDEIAAVIAYVDGWLWANDYSGASSHLREHAQEIAEQMVRDGCAIDVDSRLLAARMSYIKVLWNWHEVKPDHCGGECFSVGSIDAAMTPADPIGGEKS